MVPPESKETKHSLTQYALMPTKIHRMLPQSRLETAARPVEAKRSWRLALAFRRHARGFFAQFAAQHLASHILREFGTKLHFARRFKNSYLAATIVNDLLRGGRLALLQHHKGH